MNKARRERLEIVLEELSQLQGEEQEAFDNIPENLAFSEQAELMQENIDNIEQAVDFVNTVLED